MLPLQLFIPLSLLPSPFHSLYNLHSSSCNIIPSLFHLSLPNYHLPEASRHKLTHIRVNVAVGQISPLETHMDSFFIFTPYPHFHLLETNTVPTIHMSAFTNILYIETPTHTLTYQYTYIHLHTHPSNGLSCNYSNLSKPHLDLWSN